MTTCDRVQLGVCCEGMLQLAAAGGAAERFHRAIAQHAQHIAAAQEGKVASLSTSAGACAALPGRSGGTVIQVCAGCRETGMAPLQASSAAAHWAAKEPHGMSPSSRLSSLPPWKTREVFALPTPACRTTELSDWLVENLSQARATGLS